MYCSLLIVLKCVCCNGRAHFCLSCSASGRFGPTSDRRDSRSITHLAVNEHRRKEQPIHYTNQEAAYEQFLTTELKTFLTEEAGLQSLGWKKAAIRIYTCDYGGRIYDRLYGIQVIGSWLSTGVPSSVYCKDSSRRSDSVDRAPDSERSCSREHCRHVRRVCTLTTSGDRNTRTTIRPQFPSDESSICYLSMRVQVI